LVYALVLGTSSLKEWEFESPPRHMKKIIARKNNAGIRLDKFLKKEFFSYTRGEIIKNIKTGSILINGRATKPSHILKEDDVIAVDFKPALKKIIPNSKVEFKIIYQDENILAIEKPAGVKVHPSSFRENNTLINGLLVKFPEIEKINDGSRDSALRPGIVHRLDQDTSGIMVVAKNYGSFRELKKLFQNRQIAKKYVALVIGKIKNKKGIIEKPIAKASSYKRQIIAGLKTKTKVRPAITEYKVIKNFSNFSLIEAMPKTGRTHQIRVHLFFLGNPVAGDKKYKLRKKMKIALPKRQLLHAKELKFELFGKKYGFTSPMPDDFKDFLANID
jgi:23S rRNA pseudouridine1911/1915/1917 synthase